MKDLKSVNKNFRKSIQRIYADYSMDIDSCMRSTFEYLATYGWCYVEGDTAWAIRGLDGLGIVEAEAKITDGIDVLSIAVSTDSDLIAVSLDSWKRRGGEYVFWISYANRMFIIEAIKDWDSGRSEKFDDNGIFKTWRAG